jgi:hypothetical protein
MMRKTLVGAAVVGLLGAGFGATPAFADPLPSADANICKALDTLKKRENFDVVDAAYPGSPKDGLIGLRDFRAVDDKLASVSSKVTDEIAFAAKQVLGSDPYSGSKHWKAMDGLDNRPNVVRYVDVWDYHYRIACKRS